MITQPKKPFTRFTPTPMMGPMAQGLHECQTHTTHTLGGVHFGPKRKFRLGAPTVSSSVRIQLVDATH